MPIRLDRRRSAAAAIRRRGRVLRHIEPPVHGQRLAARIAGRVAADSRRDSRAVVWRRRESQRAARSGRERQQRQPAARQRRRCARSRLDAFLTVDSRETNLQPDGSPRINVNDEDLAGLFDVLVTAFDEDTVQFVVAYRLSGSGSGGSSGGAGGAGGGSGRGGSGGGRGGGGSGGQPNGSGNQQSGVNSCATPSGTGVQASGNQRSRVAMAPKLVATEHRRVAIVPKAVACIGLR